MIVPDVNLLVYAYDSSSVHHDAAAEWWKGCMTGGEEIGLAAVVVFGFVHHRLELQVAGLRIGHSRSRVRTAGQALNDARTIRAPTQRMVESDHRH